MSRRALRMACLAPITPAGPSEYARALEAALDRMPWPDNGFGLRMQNHVHLHRLPEQRQAMLYLDVAAPENDHIVALARDALGVFSVVTQDYLSVRALLEHAHRGFDRGNWNN